MTLRHLLADIRIFIAFFLALLGIGLVIHPDGSQWLGQLVGAVIGAAGFTAIFLVWLSALAGEK
jgi:hypothetical protein